ncbi:hypothetical protein BOQ60_26590, partial [Chryseobacterium sp. CH1]
KPAETTAPSGNGSAFKVLIIAFIISSSLLSYFGIMEAVQGNSSLQKQQLLPVMEALLKYSSLLLLFHHHCYPIS